MTDWKPLAALRTRRADDALDQVRAAEAVRHEADAARDAAAAAFEQAEQARLAQRTGLYAGATGQVLRVRDVMRLMDSLEGVDRAARLDRGSLDRLTAARDQAAAAVEEVAEVHRARRRAADKTEELQRRQEADQERRRAFFFEIEMEDLPSGRSDWHAR